MRTHKAGQIVEIILFKMSALLVVVFVPLYVSLLCLCAYFFYMSMVLANWHVKLELRAFFISW